MDCSKYDMHVNPVYQVDFSTTSKGKRLAGTKRRVKFGFGFSNPDAIEKGFKGIHCRGEEHDVTLVWSLTSGKRVVTADGEEVHFSVGKRSDLQFECSWTMKGNHVMKLVAHASGITVNKTEGFRQFDLFLDGMSYFDMPKIYELGVVDGNAIVNRGAQNTMSFASAQVHSPRYDDYGDSYDNGQSYGYEQSYDSGHYLPEEDYNRGSDYNFRAQSAIDINYAPAPRREEPRRAESMPTVDLVSEPVPTQDLLASPPAALIDQSVNHFAVDEFAPIAPPPATYNDVSHQILSAYGPAPTAPAVPALAYESHTHQQAPSAPVSYSPQNSYVAPQGTPMSTTTNTTGYFSQQAPEQSMYQQPQQQSILRDSADSPTSVRQLTDVEKAMQNLVNFDDISEPAMAPLKLSMAKVEAKKKNDGKSRPLPPTVPSWHVGGQASLAEIKTHTQPRAAPSQDVMRTHAFDPAAGGHGMMVVYGATPTEAPPLQHIRNAYGRASLNAH